MLAQATPVPYLQEQGLGDLMARYQRAEEAAAVELIRRVSPMLYRFMARPEYTQGYVEDLLQECWLRIHKARHTYRPGEPALPWILAIARNTRVDSYRQLRRIHSHEKVLEDFHELVGPAGPAEISHLDLYRQIDALPESQREVLFMLKVSGMSLQEVARATSSTVGAVKQRAHRAYGKLRGWLSASQRDLAT
ncbi:MAG: RNA polymerase sigma factor [Acidobacteria bacterium]|nr:RNA polymerase sigma factor [Acidobacteriota bacterium]